MSELRSKCCGAEITYIDYDVHATVDQWGNLLGFESSKVICPQCKKPCEVVIQPEEKKDGEK